MKDIIKLSLILAFVCVIAAASLSFIYRHTEPIITQNKQRRLNESLEKVLPDVPKSNRKEVKIGNLLERLKAKMDKKAKLYRGERPDGTVVYAAEISVGGYQGFIKLLIGFDLRKSEVLGVKVLEHTETPGLGARVLADESFLNGLKGKLKKKEEYLVDATTGATISSQAVIGGVVELLKMTAGFNR